MPVCRTRSPASAPWRWLKGSWRAAEEGPGKVFQTLPPESGAVIRALGAAYLGLDKEYDIYYTMYKVNDSGVVLRQVCR